ncbi:[protein-PII] uridylyltransferase family protein [Phaeovulum vinaykumarii]|uniref:Glutamate-ammonia-ligase adenylyltransferase n=1 Tax=Phaeovulum vinaykumarii TaxID=407234 RepID=A0A1N7LGD6_9RHOB|nr:glutamine-synthetase adenylyltransferase [Phaeovulum vinaykumarii]SIS72908.1 glutamate-ammonia-ligase adenylyltransferase [Phaeovulum vinaykumarii]SOC04560.1 glutamate-ammonia-ligase adenylyltransferase [Phaeovulum vinaykumarii]
MSFDARLLRCPVPFEPDRGSEAAARFPELSRPLRDLIAGTAGSSPYLAGLIAREADWIGPALAGRPETALDDALSGLADLSSGDLGPALRQAKRRVALLAALADLGGVWPLECVTGALTRLADAAVHHGLCALVGDEIRRGKLPGQTPEDAATAGGLVALAMGKMGAGELNYSSDIDLICLFDETRYDPADQAEARASLIKVVRRLTALLSDLTAEGYVFRTDLRLRPDAAVTPVCLSMAAAELYYEAEGRTWERAAYIKARACAGDIAAGERFLKTLTPFVWRRHLDFAAIQDAHDMRLRIRDHKGLNGPINVPGHDMKLGQGGIREIEFFTQTRQLIAGGRDPALRPRDTVGALAALAERGWLPPEVADDLTNHYRAHREIEHRIQMVNDAQTHALPTSQEGLARVVNLMGEGDVAAWSARLRDRLERVETLTGGFFAPSENGDMPELSAETCEMLERWRSYPALRSARAAGIFGRVEPEILRRMMRAANPEEALRQFDGFLSRLPAGVQLFSLFEANPHLIDLIVDICATAPGLARHLSRNAAVFDAVLAGEFFAPWPGTGALVEGLRAALEAAEDYENQLDAARRWLKEWHFHVGVHHLRGLTDAAEAATQYADLADTVLTVLWPVVIADFATRHGPPPGRGAAVLAMGSLGASRLNAASDLDLLVIYDPADAESSEGRRPLQVRSYYSRLTQALVTALSAPTSEGRLYEVDMRLRPSGRQGPVAVTMTSFESYQMEEAWTWEHLALTRARVVTGPPDLASEIETIRRRVLKAKGAGAEVAEELARMRARIFAAKAPDGAWEAKIGPGRLQDIELLAQSFALRTGDPARRVEAQIRAGRRAGLLDKDETETLLSAYRFLWRLQAGGRLLTDRALDMDTLGDGGRAFLLRETGRDDLPGLAEHLAATVARTQGVIETLLARGISAPATDAAAAAPSDGPDRDAAHG